MWSVRVLSIIIANWTSLPPTLVPASTDPTVIGYLTGVVYVRWWMQYWRMRHKIAYSETASQLVLVRKVGKCHKLHRGVAITSRSIVTNRHMNNVFTCAHVCLMHTQTHTYTTVHACLCMHTKQISSNKCLIIMYEMFLISQLKN